MTEHGLYIEVQLFMYFSVCDVQLVGFFDLFFFFFWGVGWGGVIAPSAD